MRRMCVVILEWSGTACSSNCPLARLSQLDQRVIASFASKTCKDFPNAECFLEAPVDGGPRPYLRKRQKRQTTALLPEPHHR